MNEFYNSIVDTKKEVGKIFQNLWDNSPVTNWDELQAQFHDSIELNYPSVRHKISDDISEEHNPIPKRLVTRIKVTTLLLTVIVAGGNYSKTLYMNMVEFCSMKNTNQSQLALYFNS